MSTGYKKHDHVEHREQLNPFEQLIGTLLVMIILLVAILLRSL